MKKTYIIAFICTLIDQIIKNILINIMEVGKSITIFKNFFNITLVMNDGAAFSILKSKTFFLILTSLIVIVFIINYLKKSNDVKEVEYFIYGVLLGGIIGNLIDRIIYKSVIDYLDFNIFSNHFPVFNFADICIVLSIIIITILTFKGEENGNKSWRRKR